MPRLLFWPLLHGAEAPSAGLIKALFKRHHNHELTRLFPWPELELFNKKEPLHPNVHSCTIYNSQVLEATKVPISKRVDPKTMVYFHNGILRSRKKEGAHTLCNSMDGTGDHYAKCKIVFLTVSQERKRKWSLKMLWEWEDFCTEGPSESDSLPLRITFQPSLATLQGVCLLALISLPSKEPCKYKKLADWSNADHGSLSK